MDWVVAALRSVSQVSRMQFDDCHWEIDTMSKSEKLYSLAVVGKLNRKAVKLFSIWELENCPFNVALQEELQMRLLKLLDFVAASESKKTQSK